MNTREIEHMWKVASNNPNHDTNWHDPVVVAFAQLVAQQEYERGVIYGMQKQAQSSVDKAVNAMSQRQWVGLTDEEIDAEADKEEQAHGFIQGVAWADAKLKEKNT
jgi:hypothetical protein